MLLGRMHNIVKGNAHSIKKDYIKKYTTVMKYKNTLVDIIIALSKKPSTNEYEFNRKISLKNHILKLIMKILTNITRSRVKPEIDVALFTTMEQEMPSLCSECYRCNTNADRSRHEFL